MTNDYDTPDYGPLLAKYVDGAECNESLNYRYTGDMLGYLQNSS